MTESVESERWWPGGAEPVAVALALPLPLLLLLLEDVGEPSVEVDEAEEGEAATAGAFGSSWPVRRRACGM